MPYHGTGSMAADTSAGTLGVSRRRRRVGLVAAGLLGTSMLVAPPGVADEGDDQGTVEASVEAATPPEACILLSEDEVDFGVVDFDETTEAPPYEVESCADDGQSLFGASSDATGEDELLWEVDADGETGDNRFAVDALLDDGDPTFLGDQETTEVGGVAPDAAAEANHTVLAPAEGSEGAGEQLDFDLTWTAIVEHQWFSQDSDSEVVLRDVAFVDDQTGWVVGQFGTVLHTDDGGETWNTQDTGSPENLFDVTFVDDQTGWAVGTDRLGPTHRVIFTTDGGETWDRTDLDSRPVGVAFVDEQTGWVVGRAGYVVRTDDGGETWQDQDPGTDETLESVAFVDDVHGWAIGDGGTVVHTDDGGDTWDSQDPGTDESLNGVAFVDDVHGWAVGNNGTIVTYR